MLWGVSSAHNRYVPCEVLISPAKTPLGSFFACLRGFSGLRGFLRKPLVWQNPSTAVDDGRGPRVR